MISDTLESGREHPTEEEVIVRIDCHLVLKLAKMKEGVGGSRVMVEGGHHKLQKTECGDFVRQW